MRREKETHNFFLCWLFHLTPPQTTGLALASSENCLSSSSVESQLTVFFQIPKSSVLPGMTSFTSLVPFPIWGFYCDISDCHIRRLRVNTCTQCVHLTNPCTKWKVLSLTKPKGKLYKTKNDNMKKKSPRNYITIKCQIHFYTNNQFYFKQFSLAWVHSLIAKKISITSYSV